MCFSLILLTLYWTPSVGSGVGEGSGKKWFSGGLSSSLFPQGVVSLPTSSNLLTLVPLLGLEKHSADSESLLGPRSFCEVLTALSVCHAPLEIPLLEGFPLEPWCLAASQGILDLITCFHCFSSLWPWGWGLGGQ